MVLVHLLPMLGGFYLSFKNLNTFTFSRLFDAPWAGLDNYRSILFESDNPLRSGFTTRRPEHGPLHVLDRARHARRRARRGAAAAPADARHQARARADADALDRPELRRRGALAVHVAERHRDHQQGPRRLHAHPLRAAGVADRGELAVGDHHPQRLARPAVRDADPARRPAGDAAGAARGGGDRRRRPVAPLPLHHAAAAAAADRRAAAVQRHLLHLPVRDPVRDVREQPGTATRT